MLVRVKYSHYTANSFYHKIPDDSLSFFLAKKVITATSLAFWMYGEFLSRFPEIGKTEAVAVGLRHRHPLDVVSGRLLKTIWPYGRPEIKRVQHSVTMRGAR